MKVLIVEDSSFARMAVKKVIGMILPNTGFIEAADGEEGLVLALDSKPDLILTDMLMPKMQGDKMIAAIRTRDPKVPIIVMTANTQKPTREKFEALGINGFVLKPVNSASIEQLRVLLAAFTHVD